MVRKSRTRNRREADRYQSINEWMEAKGVNGTQLLYRLKTRCNRSLSKGHLSDVLKGSRRCSLGLAIDLSKITGVSIEAIAKWPRTSKKVRESLISPVSDGIAV